MVSATGDMLPEGRPDKTSIGRRRGNGLECTGHLSRDGDDDDQKRRPSASSDESGKGDRYLVCTHVAERE